MPRPDPNSFRVRAVRAALRYPPLRAPRVRMAILSLYRSYKRVRRRLAELRGDRTVLQPALHGMDRKLDNYLSYGGYFIEAGANDGYDQSNTYYLEREKGWHGILVEPVPHLYRALKRERPRALSFNCALVPFGYPGDHIEMRYAGLMSIVVGTHGSEGMDRKYVAPALTRGLEEERVIVVPARTLTSVLEEANPPEIDLLSLDVEGYEEDVLRGLDWDRFPPRFCLIEIRDEQRRRPIEETLGDRYIQVDQLSPFDTLYARRDVASSIIATQAGNPEVGRMLSRFG